MTKEEMHPEAYEKLVNSIEELLLTQGLKATTMDSIAASLQMSKRTLYEIFGSKNEMIYSVLEASHKRHGAELKEIFTQSSNVMEGLLRGFLYHRDEMRKVNVGFFRDLDSLFADARDHSTFHKTEALNRFLPVYEKGVKQGYFRKNLNFILHCRLLWIQMESLKRMEEFFPADISLLEAYDTISISFLRTIATPKGLAILDNVVDKLDDNLQPLSNKN